MEGAFYLHAPLDYASTAALTEPSDGNSVERPLPGHAEIVFTMERVRELAEAEGNDNDILTLEGPDNAHDRHNKSVLAWFEGHEQGDLQIHRVQILRSELRQFWIWQLIPQVVSQIEKMGNSVGEGRDGEIVHFLNALQAKTGKDCLTLHQRERLDTHTEVARSPGSSGMRF